MRLGMLVRGLLLVKLYSIALLVTFRLCTADASRAADWGLETLGTAESLENSQPSEVDTYKRNLLQYVLQTMEPKETGDGERMPFVMDRIYNLLADKNTGKQKRSAPFDVDYIRGFEDHYKAERRMQFWFNASAINQTEDIIECYFHIYKRVPLETRRAVGRQPHSISVSLYRILNEDSMFDVDGNAGDGVQLLERQQLSAYTSEWIVFKSNLKDTIKAWIKHPQRNKGLLLTATDSDNRHINGSHIDFIQRGEMPSSNQPLFVVYTDQERKKNNKHKKKHRKNIKYLIENFLNENAQTQRVNSQLCSELLDDDQESSTEQCQELLLRHRRSLVDPTVDIEDDIISFREPNIEQMDDDTLQPNGGRHGRLQIRHRKDLLISANRRKQDEETCQVKPLYISFQALGWGKWIVAPDGLNANYCDGSCPFPLTGPLTASNHALLQSVSNYYHPNKIKAPCCVPQNLARMSILYHQDESTVTMRNYDDMIVESCGCR